MNGAAQIDEDETGEKAGLAAVYPAFTWLNPEYMSSIDASSLAYGQLTSFVQISSAYVSLEKAELTEAMAAGLLKSMLDHLGAALNDPADQEARGNLMLASAAGMTGVTSFGKTGDWTLMPLTGMMQTFLGIPYTKALTILFPHFLKEIYNGDRIFQAYFRDVLGTETAGKNDDEILTAGLDDLWAMYRRFGVAVDFSELTGRQANADDLQPVIEAMGEMPSQYGSFTAARIMKIVRDAIGTV